MRLTYAERFAVETEARGDFQGWEMIQVAVCPERQYRANPREHKLEEYQWRRAEHLRDLALRLAHLRKLANETHADRAGLRARSI